MNIFNYFNIGRKAVALAAFLFTTSTFAQKTCMDVEKVTVNENVTTVITASEPIQVVDISTDKVAGANPLENVVTVKPKQGGYKDGEVLAIVTVITERYRVQYSADSTCKCTTPQSYKIFS